RELFGRYSIGAQKRGDIAALRERQDIEMSTTVYTFGGGAKHDDPRARDKTITGGKGSNLSEMAEIGLPVPPGFTITTEECVRYLAEGADFTADLRANVATALAHVERAVGKDFGNAADPLLVSVRSGARVSM